MISVPSFCATSIARADLPEAVGPVMTIMVGLSKFQTVGLLFSDYAADVDNDIARFFHGLNGNKLEASMKVFSAGEDVGAGETFE